MERIRRMVKEKEKGDRKNNIVIKKIDIKGVFKDRREWAEDFLKNRLGIE